MRKKSYLFISIFLLYFSVLYATEFTACEGRIQQICENTSGTLIAASDSSSITIYDTKDYSIVCKFYDEQVSKISFYSEGDNEFFAVITKDGQFIVRKLLYSDEHWQCEDGEPYYSADCADVTGRKALTAISFSNNSDYIAAAFNDNSVQVHFRLRVTAGSISHTITTHKTQVYGLEFSKNGEYLATVSTDGEAYIWNSYTSSRITHLKGIYSRARVPVYFTEDSVYVVSLDSRNSFRISDFSGNTLYSILTGRPITAIKPLKDPDLIAVRNDKNEVMIYSISARRPISVVNAATTADFTAFDYTLSADSMYAGYSDGMVAIFEPQPYLDDTSMLVTDSTLLGNGKGNVAVNRFQSVSITTGANYLNKPYLISVNLSGEYRYCDKTAPWFFGGGALIQYGFPRSEFPTTYKIRGVEVDPPKLFSTAIYIPTGFIFSPWANDFSLITEVKLGLKISTLMLLSDGYIIGEPVYSVFLSGGAGVIYKIFESTVNFEYDTAGKLSPSVYAGVSLKLGGKN